MGVGQGRIGKRSGLLQPFDTAGLGDVLRTVQRASLGDGISDGPW